VGSRPNTFEQAILDCIAVHNPEILAALPDLRVSRREFTGVGSYTDFKRHFPVALADGYRGLDRLIHMPGVENGMGAVLAVTSGQLDHLEIFTYGADQWSGDFRGFAIDDGA
jgi:hypothetical protein